MVFRKATKHHAKKFAKKRQVQQHLHSGLLGHDTQKNFISNKMVLYSAPAGMPFPEIYITKLRTRFSGVIASASFAAGGVYNMIIEANNSYNPFTTLSAAGITWVDAATPRTSSMAGYARLANVNMYTNAIVLSTRLKVYLTPSDTAANDSILCCITPSNTTAGGAPATTTAALVQPFCKHEEIRSFGAKAKPVVNTVKWSRFLGIKQDEFENDPANTYGQIEGAAPSNILYLIVNLAMLDAALPSAAMPFTLEMDQIVKFEKFTAGQFS